ncbi:MAG: hypothetical protein Q8P41_17185 [Pseudomonadota bacterium]|nr:hypothetical protein [Pseudomonadota bacterium]
MFDLLDAKLYSILDDRGTEVFRVGEDVDEVDLPPAWQEIGLAVGLIALSAATAGIGTAVAGAFAAGAAGAAMATASAATGAIVTEMVKVSTEEGLSAALGAAFGSPSPATNTKDQFFRTQEDAFKKLRDADQDDLILNVRDRIRESADPLSLAFALVRAFEAGSEVAAARQREATLASWCNFLARADLGTASGRGKGTGVDLEEQVGDTSAKGVLGVRVALSDGTDSLDVVDAEMEGLNEALRGSLAARPIGELGVSMTVQGAGLRIGENEGGRRWNESGEGGTRWLANRAAGEEIPDEDWAALGPLGRLDLIDEGMERSLEDDIKPKSLAALGVNLDG